MRFIDGLPGSERTKSLRQRVEQEVHPSDVKYDEPGLGDLSQEATLRSIRKVSVPATNAIYGKSGPLRDPWRRSRYGCQTL